MIIALAVIIGLKRRQGALGPGLYPELRGRSRVQQGGAMAKHHSRPSREYRYEHYDPRM